MGNFLNVKNIIKYNLMGRFYFYLIDCFLLDISNNLI